MDFAKQEFVLKSTFQNLAERKEVYSLVETHFNVPWRILVECFNEGLKVFLICKNTTRSNLWSIDVDFTIKLTSAAYSFNKCISGTFNRSNTTLGWDDFTQWKGMIERSPTKPGGLHTPVVAIEKLNVEIHAEIKRIIGVNRKRTVKFDEMDENVTDVCLIVEQKKFFVSKTFLASFSKVFHVMFFGEFVEKGAAEVVIQDVNADVFKVFLSLIYVTSDPGITGKYSF
uniref:BTB domain-containing protein n=1 Tax=Caenorhabditis japonica TaxID=281687 RepID=A0A8R1INA2_CAEJA